MTVHSRGAEVEVIRRLTDARLPAILHWYTGPIGPIDSALDAGLYFSINIAMTRSKKFPALLRALPRDRILLETDGPYAKDGGRSARPAQLRDLVDHLSHAWNTDPQDAIRTVLANQQQLLQAP